ncbi:hypothetical protein EG328_010530 [Venturia inaequalis]|uniref:Myb-like domain-containing protein n=1 Tax=Venturia inaequalis TaxID=5025 RepID=A0A8H3VIP2_VENIN|nr:hypothetical protein EG328_010530 [Venturia inaequalis]RDI81425.1 hypothetical protein Vi05172_g8561 [Venturia inaequalis]
MDFNDGNNFLGGWSKKGASKENTEEPGRIDWSDEDSTSGFSTADFGTYQPFSQPAQQNFSPVHQNFSPVHQNFLESGQPAYQSFPQPSPNWQHTGVISQAPMPAIPIPMPTTPISNDSRLLTPVSSPWDRCNDAGDFSYSCSGFSTPLAPGPINSHLTTPPTWQACNNNTSFGDPASTFDFTYQSQPLTPDYPLTSPGYSVDTPSYPLDTPSYPLDTPSYPLDTPSYPLDSPSYSVNSPSYPLDSPSYLVESPSYSANTPSYPLGSSPANSYFNLHSPSESQYLNSPLPLSFLDSLQFQLPFRLVQWNNMGQESSQMAPPTANTPALSAPFKVPSLVEQSHPPRGASGHFTAINKSPLLQSPVEATSSKREDQRKTKRKRLEEVTVAPKPSQHRPKVKATRSPPPSIQSPSPSPSLSESPIAETSLQATSREQTPQSDASENLARSPMSSQESVTEESEPETPTDGGVTPKRRKTSRTPPTTPSPPATPVVTSKRVPKSGGRPRASASGSPRSRASPPRPKSGRGPTQPINTGRYTEKELALLTEAVHAWRDDHGLTQFAMNDLVNSNARTNEFPGGLWDFICGALPDRERHSVQKAVKRKFNNRKRGAWTPADDEELCHLYKMYKNQWQRIGEENNRGAEASRDRWRNYCKNGKAQQSGEWTPAEEKRLAHLMRDAVQVLVDQRIRDIKVGKSVPEHFDPAELMDFGILSEKMGGTRSRLQCRNKFEKFKARDSQHLAIIIKPKEVLDGLDFEATTKEAGRKSKSKSRISSARLSEEAEALHNYKEKMLIGDQYNILISIQRALQRMPEDTDEDSIPWDEIIERDHDTTWSILDHKTVLRQMQILYPAPDDQTCLEFVSGVIDILEADYDDEELQKFYVDRPRSTRKQRTYTKKGSRARNSISAIKVGEEDDDYSPARSLPTPGSMDDDDEEDGV